MTDFPDPAPRPGTARAEKLRAVAAVFGEAMAARLEGGSGGGPETARTAVPPDPQRLAWQTNRLIRHLRDRVDRDPAMTATAQAAAPPDPRAGQGREVRDTGGPRPLPFLVAGEDLAAEHPAVIAHILRAEPQQIRVSVLRALPGPVSRAVIQRLRPKDRPGGA